MNEFIEQYIKTMLWSSTGCDERPLDADFGPEDLSDEAMAEVREDCEGFIEMAGDLIEDNMSGAGHDFWLTRNGHGAGFWDGDWKEGDKLTEISKTFGGQDPYVGDDGMIYL